MIDCGKTFRDSLLKWFPSNNVSYLDAVILTHEHTDAIGGIDDLRDTQLSLEHAISIFANEFTFNSVRQKYNYLFNNEKTGRRVAQIKQEVIFDNKPFVVGDMPFTPLRLLHGGSYICLGFAFGSPDLVVYLSDFHEVPEETYLKLRDKHISVLVLDMLRYGPHVAHVSVEQSITTAKQFLRTSKVERVLFIGMNHELEHEATNNYLKEQFKGTSTKVELAYDGMNLDLRLLEE